jgi:hypothetical protein
VTKEEFVRDYARRSGTTVKHLRELGMWAEPCDCGIGDCAGWKMCSQPPTRYIIQRRVARKLLEEATAIMEDWNCPDEAIQLVKQAAEELEWFPELEDDDECEHCGGSSKSPCFACSGAGKKT